MNHHMEMTNDATRLRWTYDELIRIESSRTDELQHQQQRVATVLVANNFILGLLANHALGNPRLSWEVGVELASIIVLAVAVVLGLVALWPRIPPRGEQSDNGEDAKRSALVRLVALWPSIPPRGEQSDKGEDAKRSALFRLLARWPRTPPRGEQSDKGVEDAERPGLFLDSDYFLRSLMDGGETDTLKTLCSALGRNITQSGYNETINLRRWFLQRQLALIAIGVVLLAIAAGIALFS